MWSTARDVAPGDTVIVWLTRDQLQPLVITPGKDLNTKFGNFRQADLVGVPYGSKVPARSGKGFIHVLRPTPELWTLALPHRTQILYLADIAFITAALHIRSGSRVVEAGTGSGSFSHSIARSIGPTGRLFSFEFHEARFLKAREEFAQHRMGDVVALAHRNVCKDGFGGAEGVDAVFLDLPAPWDAVGHAKEAMRKDRVARICCFSPCIEQVLRTVSALNEAGFTEITMYETLLRPIEVFQTPAAPSVAGLAEQLKQSEVRREEKRQRQIAANKQALAAKEGGKRKRAAVDVERDADAAEGEGEDGTVAAEVVVVEEDDGTADHAPTPKRARTDAPGVVVDGGADTVSAFALASTPTPLPGAADTAAAAAAAAPTPVATPILAPTPGAAHAALPPKLNVSKALPEVRGHTSYLTFASLVPVPAAAVAAAASATTSSVEATPAPTPALDTAASADGPVPTTTTSSAPENAPAAS